MSEAPERIWAWWDDAYDVGLLNEHGDKRYTPNDAKEYVRADRIEELEARLEACKKYRDAYAECDRIGTQAVRDLQAKLAKAVEALGNISNIGVAWSSKYEDQIKEAQGIARATLAELKGETDE